MANSGDPQSPHSSKRTESDLRHEVMVSDDGVSGSDRGAAQASDWEIGSLEAQLVATRSQLQLALGVTTPATAPLCL
jgi:hypothetical protein